MREILFRAKRIDNGEWVEGGFHKHIKRTPCPIGDSLEDDDIAYLIIESGFSDWNIPKPLFSYQVDPETVGQYTGMKDIVGKRIFEGDILEFWQPEFDLTDKSWGIVRYFADEDYPAFDIETLNVDSNGLSYIMANCECEIIGNIHDNDDNPELLVTE